MNYVDSDERKVLSPEELLKENRGLKRKLALAESILARIKMVDAAQDRVESVLDKTIEKERRFFRLVLENMTSLLLLLDFDERFAYASESFLKTVGIDYFALIGGSHYRDVLKPYMSEVNLSIL
jgi:PAS domain-containing protein